jgi:hypothetical protein
MSERALAFATTRVLRQIERFVFCLTIRSVGGIMVSIAAFQAVDPGSIPGHRIIFTIFLFLLKLIFNVNMS